MNISYSLKNLIFSLILNVIFISFFLRAVDDPIFITGNKQIIFFNLYLFSFFILLKFLNTKRRKFYFMKNFSFYSIFSSFLISCLISIIFWSLFPSIIDRSLSVNVIGTLNSAEESLDLDQIDWSLKNNYMDGKYQAEKRLNEQIFLGNIYIVEKNKYILSKKGRYWARFNILLSKYFNLDKRSSKPEFVPPKNNKVSNNI